LSAGGEPLGKLVDDLIAYIERHAKLLCRRTDDIATRKDHKDGGKAAILRAEGEDGDDRSTTGLAPFRGTDGVSLMTATPQPTQHLTFAIDDSRTLE
jgi:hypothetical protein